MLEAGRDQAESLRRLFDASTLRVLPVVGSAPLAEMFARTLAGDRRVVVLDHAGDELARAFGRPVRFDLATLLWGDRQFEDVATRVTDRLTIVPARAGLDQFLDYAREHKVGSDSLFAGFLRLSQPYEWLVMHTRSLACAAELLGAAGEVLVAVDGEAESIKEAYLGIKEAAEVAPGVRVRVAVMAPGEYRAREVYRRLAAAAERFLGVSVQYGLALPAALRPSAELGVRLRSALGGWQLAEFGAPVEDGAQMAQA